jgi:hypothetical protein
MLSSLESHSFPQCIDADRLESVRRFRYFGRECGWACDPPTGAKTRSASSGSALRFISEVQKDADSFFDLGHRVRGNSAIKPFDSLFRHRSDIVALDIVALMKRGVDRPPSNGAWREC